MNVDQLRELLEELRCPLCLEIFTDPRVLPCQHSFCTNCLQNHFYSSHKNFLIRCPICRKKVEVPNNIEGLPLNISLLNIVRNTAITEIKRAVSPDIISNINEYLPPAASFFPSVDYSFSSLSDNPLQFSNYHFQHEMINISKTNIDVDKAKIIFDNWIKEFWFVPGDFRNKIKSSEISITEILVPFYNFSFQVDATYQYKFSTYFDPKTFHSNSPSSMKFASPSISVSKFSGIQNQIVCGTDSPLICKFIDSFLIQLNPDNILHRRITFNENSLVTLPWFAAWKFHNVNKMLVSKLEECIIKDLNDEFSYNHVEILHLQHKFSNLVHSITYVPFFVSSYQYDSTTYHFCISSQDGKIVGDRPYGLGSLPNFLSWLKPSN